VLPQLLHFPNLKAIIIIIICCCAASLQTTALVSAEKATQIDVKFMRTRTSVDLARTAYVGISDSASQAGLLS
jgi:ABC-type cobalamin transport system permease subunit